MDNYEVVMDKVLYFVVVDLIDDIFASETVD